MRKIIFFNILYNFSWYIKFLLRIIDLKAITVSIIVVETKEATEIYYFIC